MKKQKPKLTGTEHAIVNAMIIGRERIADVKIKRARDKEIEKAVEGDPRKDMRIYESFQGSYSGGEVIEPPYDLEVLTMLPEMSSILPQCIDAMKQNCEGFGYSLTPVIKEKDNDAMNKQIQEQIDDVNNFFENVNYDFDIETLRKMLRQDYEATGNSYVEIIRNQKDEIAGLEYIQSKTMRLTTQDKEYTEFEILKINRKTNKIEKEKREKRFRRYMQTVKEVTIFFKELDDPREINKSTGMPVTDQEREEAKMEGKEIKLATEAYHFKIHNSRSPYGIPRWIGGTIAVLGNRACEEVNYDFFDNKAVPPLVLLVSGGTLTDDTVKRVTRYVDENIKGRENFHKILIIEALPMKSMPAVGETVKPVKIEIKELSQIDDAKFAGYQKDNDTRVRSSFRLPPLYIGKSEDYTKATAKESRQVAEPQVFSPERKVFDNFTNKKIFPSIGITLLRYKSKSAPENVAEEWNEILTTFSKTGLTPREIRKIIDHITDIELEDYETKDENKRWLDIPLDLAIKEAGQSSVVKMISDKKDGTRVDKDDMTELAVKILRLRELLSEMHRDKDLNE